MAIHQVVHFYVKEGRKYLESTNDIEGAKRATG